MQCRAKFRSKICFNVQDEGLAAICEGCPNIRYLCISNCPHLTDQTLVRDPIHCILLLIFCAQVNVANHCPNLVILECAGLSLLTDAGFIVSHNIQFWFLLKLSLNCVTGSGPILPQAGEDGSGGVCPHHWQLHLPGENTRLWLVNTALCWPLIGQTSTRDLIGQYCSYPPTVPVWNPSHSLTASSSLMRQSGNVCICLSAKGCPQKYLY